MKRFEVKHPARINITDRELVVIWLLIVGVSSLFFGASYISYPQSKKIQTVEHTQITDTLSFRDELLTLIFELRLEHPYIVFAQAVLESGHFNSTIFLENNNLFGMKMPYRRATTAIGINRGHAVYESWRHSVYDYALFQMAFMRGLTTEQYLARLRSYAQDENYTKKIESTVARVD